MVDMAMVDRVALQSPLRRTHVKKFDNNMNNKYELKRIICMCSCNHSAHNISV